MAAVHVPRVFARIRFWISFTAIVTAFFLLYLYSIEGLDRAEQLMVQRHHFQWIQILNVTSLARCRNSAQGQEHITDELGFFCPIQNVTRIGCCNTSSPLTKRFYCETCHARGCCKRYENCVSCCLDPDKQPLMISILSRATQNYNPLYSSLKDQFELCLTKCRTSSKSVLHENVYRNPVAKHCYGDEPMNQL